MIKAVFFDLDDTLFNQTHSSMEALRIIRNTYDELQVVSLDELWKIHNELLNVIHKEYVLTGRMTINEARRFRFKELFNKLNIRMIYDERIPVYDLYRDIYLQERVLVSGAVELLNELSCKYKLVIISNNEHQEQINKLSHLGIIDYFEDVITSEKAGYSKPDKRIFDFALEKLNLHNSEAVLIGDSWETDIIGALNAGIKSIWFNRHGNIKPDGYDIPEINSLVPAENIIRLIY